MKRQKICGIYKITNSKNRIYIGQSVDIYSRIRCYKTLNCKKQIKLYKSIKKYGWDTHIVEIIKECEREKLNELEVFYIDFYKSTDNRRGLNLMSGGQNSKHSDETRAKMSKSRKGLNTWMKGRKLTDEHKANISKGNKGAKHDYWKGKVGARLGHKQTPWNKGKKTGQKPWNTGLKNPFSEETLKKLSESGKRRYELNPPKKKTEAEKQKMREVWAKRKADKLCQSVVL